MKINFPLKKVFDIDEKYSVYSLLLISIISGLAMNASDTTLAPSSVRTFFRITCYLSSFILIAKNVKQDNKASYSHYILISVFFYWLMGVVNPAQGVGPQLAPLFVLEMLGFAFAPDKVKYNAFVLYKWFIVVMSIFGLLAIFSFWVYPLLNYEIVPFYGANSQNSLYYDYKFAYLFVDNMDGIRLCGLFNEPGYFGTMLALLLVSEKLDIRKPEVCIMLIAGLFTFSVAFFVTLAIYIVVRFINKLPYLLLSLVILIYIARILPTLHFEDRMLDILVQRLSFEDGKLSGDNRDYVNTDALMRTFNNSTDVFFGRGMGATKDLGVSFLMIIIQMGYVGVFLTFGTLFWAGWKFAKKNLSALVFLACFFINIYQRTNVFNMNYFLLLFGGLLYINSSSYNDKSVCKYNE